MDYDFSWRMALKNQRDASGCEIVIGRPYDATWAYGDIFSYLYQTVIGPYIAAWRDGCAIAKRQPAFAGGEEASLANPASGAYFHTGRTFYRHMHAKARVCAFGEKHSPGPETQKRANGCWNPAKKREPELQQDVRDTLPKRNLASFHQEAFAA